MDSRRKKLIYQSQHRGMKENDILLGRFADANVDSMSSRELDLFEALMAENDNDLYDWIIGKKERPVRLDHEVFAAIVRFRETL